MAMSAHGNECALHQCGADDFASALGDPSDTHAIVGLADARRHAEEGGEAVCVQINANITFHPIHSSLSPLDLTKCRSGNLSGLPLSYTRSSRARQYKRVCEPSVSATGAGSLTNEVPILPPPCSNTAAAGSHNRTRSAAYPP